MTSDLFKRTENIKSRDPAGDADDTDLSVVCNKSEMQTSDRFHEILLRLCSDLGYYLGSGILPLSSMKHITFQIWSMQS